MYIYEGHLGGLYATEYPLDYDDLYCEECGDSDWLIGYANNKKEAWKLFEGKLDINGSGGWNYEYVKNFINEHFS